MAVEAVVVVVAVEGVVIQELLVVVVVRAMDIVGVAERVVVE